MTIDFNSLKKPEFRGSFSKLPGCQLLNDKAKPGLFITADNMKLAGWSGGEKDGELYSHTYNDGTEKAGRFFLSPRLLIVLSSPRLVELTRKGQEFNPQLGKHGDIIGNYESYEGYLARESLDKGCTTLRTLHLIYLVNEKKELLHKVPLTLSVHGAAAAIFGNALNQFYTLLEIAYSDAQEEQEGGFYTLDSKARAIAIFQPTFKFEMVGDKEKSPVCSVKTFVEPTNKNVESLFCFPLSQRIWGTQQSLAGFADKYFTQFQQSNGYHQVKEGVIVDAKALPAGKVINEDMTADDF